MQTAFSLQQSAQARSSKATQKSAGVSKFTSWTLFISVLLVSALYLAIYLKRGWIPHDEGALAQSAERALQGELPHRDFDEIYTGLLSYVNAAGFRLFGTKLVSMRYMLYLFFLAWLPSVYYIARRFVSPVAASAVTLLAVAWSVPNYPAAMPSWYNLFCATFAVAALLRYIQIRARVWLFVAGLCGGISFLFKLSGLYLIVGILLFLLFRDQFAPVTGPADRRAIWFYRSFLALAVLIFEAFLFAVIQKMLAAVTFLYFLVPGLALGGTVLWHACARNTPRSGRFKILLGEIGVFALGIAVPVAIFLIPYALSGSVAQFFHGVFVLPAKRFAYVNTASVPRKLKLLIGILGNVVVVGATFLAVSKGRKLLVVLSLLGAPALLLLAFWSPTVYQGTWSVFWAMPPVAVTIGGFILVSKNAISKDRDGLREDLFLLLCVVTACSLIQFPVSGATYFSYVAPLVALAITALVSLIPNPPRLFLSVFYVVALVYAVPPVFADNLGRAHAKDDEIVELRLPRVGGLRVTAYSVWQYEKLASIVSEHARGQYMYAAPDCPQMYFLFGLRNPTRTLFDFFDEPVGRTERIVNTIHEHGVNIIVIQNGPAFSGSIAADLRAELEREFPNTDRVGRFEVRWK